MGCMVQLYESTNRHGTRAKHLTDGWYLGTSTGHYQCHIIYVKKTRSAWILETVFLKHKHITQPTLTQADITVKAINNLTHALKGRKNVKGDAQIIAFEKIDELLNKIPKKIQATKEKQVTFDETATPPRETNVRTMTPATKPKSTATPSLEKATVDKPIPAHTPTPRVCKRIYSLRPAQPQFQGCTANQRRISHPKWQLQCKICKVATNQARLSHCHNMQLCQQEQHEHAQLIRGKETEEYLNYQLLIQDPKHKVLWNTSAVFEFGRLAQEVGGQIKQPTNTNFFIPKSKVPTD